MTALVASRKAGTITPGGFPDITTAAAAIRVNRPAEAIEILSRIDPDRPDVRGWMLYWRNLALGYHLLGDTIKK